MRLGKKPGYLKLIERWSALRDWRGRAGAWDAHLQAERDEVARQEAAKWERRRLQALEDGWQTCQALRARLGQMLALPPEMPAVPRPSRPGRCRRPSPRPSRHPRRPGRRRDAGRCGGTT